MCGSGGCTATACCRTETGEPLPSTRPAELPKDREVIQYKTRISNLMHGKMGGMLADLDRNIKPVFATAAGVGIDQVRTEYEAGSVLVTATATANAGQALETTILPTEEAVLGAVLDVPNIDDAKVPGTEITAAAPVGVKFVAGSDDAVTVTSAAPGPGPGPPPPPPPAATTTDAEDSEKNETRS